MALPGASRLVCALASLVVLVVALTAICGLLSRLYSDYAHEIERRAPGSDAAVASSAFARGLAPWDAQARARSSEALASMGDLDGATEQTAAAIRLAPADAYRWLQHARLIGQQGRFDAYLAALYQTAIDLDPNAGPLRMLIALDGVQRWRFGDDTLHALWLDSTRMALRYTPRQLLRQVARLRRENPFCAYAEPELPGLKRWCANAPRVRRDCSLPTLNAAQTHWCLRVGFIPPQTR